MMVLGHEAAGIVAECGPGVAAIAPGDHVIFWFRQHCGCCRHRSTGQTVLCIGRNDSPRWPMHDGTVRVQLNGGPANQMARIGAFSEEVVCPAEQVVKIRSDLPFTPAAIIGCSVATGIGAVIRQPGFRPGRAC
ncbi:MAG TPA: alcohol dehydrogenase catalytic domain-containing protein [Stellaceae bacterium]|jgi:S-(hydroxymethyl)glutathione dehydrogenase/alcohol dehydrogenase